MTTAKSTQSSGQAFARRSKRAILLALPVAAACFAMPAQAALTFSTVFDSSFDPNAVSAVNSVLAGYSTLFSDNVNVSLKFSYSGNGLGSTATYGFDVNYQTYYNALVADATSAADAIALANIAGGANNPVDGGTSFIQGRPGLAAVGISVDTSGIADYFDGEIDLNLGLLNYDRTNIDPNKYDLQAVLQHEVNEVLGIISNVGGSSARPVDMFRYDSAGNLTWTKVGDDAYFSIDGTHLLARYNQDPGGDYGDFWSCSDPTGTNHTPQVQDACSSPGATPNMDVELTMLDVVGWNLSSTQSTVPEPASLALVFTGLLGFLARKRRA